MCHQVQSSKPKNKTVENLESVSLKYAIAASQLDNVGIRRIRRYARQTDFTSKSQITEEKIFIELFVFK